MPSKLAQVLVIEPAHEIVFVGSFNSTVEATLTLRNPTNKPIVYKIKTTAPNYFTVRPNFDEVLPFKQKRVKITWLGLEFIPKDGKTSHRFMVQSVFAPSGGVPNKRWLFEKESIFTIMETKLECVFLSTPLGLHHVGDFGNGHEGNLNGNLGINGNLGSNGNLGMNFADEANINGLDNADHRFTFDNFCNTDNYFNQRNNENVDDYRTNLDQIWDQSSRANPQQDHYRNGTPFELEMDRNQHQIDQAQQLSNIGRWTSSEDDLYADPMASLDSNLVTRLNVFIALAFLILGLGIGIGMKITLT